MYSMETPKMANSLPDLGLAWFDDRQTMTRISKFQAQIETVDADLPQVPEPKEAASKRRPVSLLPTAGRPPLTAQCAPKPPAKTVVRQSVGRCTDPPRLALLASPPLLPAIPQGSSPAGKFASPTEGKPDHRHASVSKDAASAEPPEQNLVVQRALIHDAPPPPLCSTFDLLLFDLRALAPGITIQKAPYSTVPSALQRPVPPGGLFLVYQEENYDLLTAAVGCPPTAHQEPDWFVTSTEGVYDSGYWLV